MAVYLMQELDSFVRPRLLWGPKGPETNPTRLRDTYESWVTSVIREGVSRSLKCREQVKRRAGRTRSDEEVLARWLAARNDEFPRWIQQFGSGQEWDFSLGSLGVGSADSATGVRTGRAAGRQSQHPPPGRRRLVFRRSTAPRRPRPKDVGVLRRWYEVGRKRKA
jgi:hypothetical protein